MGNVWDQFWNSDQSRAGAAMMKLSKAIIKAYIELRVKFCKHPDTKSKFRWTLFNCTDKCGLCNRRIFREMRQAVICRGCNAIIHGTCYSEFLRTAGETSTTKDTDMNTLSRHRPTPLVPFHRMAAGRSVETEEPGTSRMTRESAVRPTVVPAVPIEPTGTETGSSQNGSARQISDGPKTATTTTTATVATGGRESVSTSSLVLLESYPQLWPFVLRFFYVLLWDVAITVLNVFSINFWLSR